MLCLDSPSFDRVRSFDDELSWSPGSGKLVGTCKNCSFSFRIGSKNSSDGFCSKGEESYHSYSLLPWHLYNIELTDCRTCYTLFYKVGSSTPISMNEQKTAAEVKHAIFQFQCQIDEESLRFVIPQCPEPIQKINPTCAKDKTAISTEKTKNTKSGKAFLFSTPRRSQSNRFNAFIWTTFCVGYSHNNLL